MHKKSQGELIEESSVSRMADGVQVCPLRRSSQAPEYLREVEGKGYNNNKVKAYLTS